MKKEGYIIEINIEVNKKSGLPLYMQVKKQIMDLIKNDQLKVGLKLPTERELSKQLGVSRNTISVAYNELEQEGVLKSYQGKGTFVAEEVLPWKEQNGRNKIIKFVDLGLEEALEMGMDIDEFLSIVIKRVQEKKDIISKITAIYVECNIEQSRMFSKQLNKTTNMDVVPVTIGMLKEKNAEAFEAVDKAQVIIVTFNHINEVAKLLEGKNKEIIGVAIKPDLETIVKIARYPEETRFGLFCISEEFKFKIRSALEEAGLQGLNIVYSNTRNQEEIQKIVANSDIIIVSPGRHSDVKKYNNKKKDIIEFLYSLDRDSIKALQSKIIEIKSNNFRD